MQVRRTSDLSQSGKDPHPKLSQVSDLKQVRLNRSSGHWQIIPPALIQSPTSSRRQASRSRAECCTKSRLGPQSWTLRDCQDRLRSSRVTEDRHLDFGVYDRLHSTIVDVIQRQVLISALQIVHHPVYCIVLYCVALDELDSLVCLSSIPRTIINMQDGPNSNPVYSLEKRERKKISCEDGVASHRA